MQITRRIRSILSLIYSIDERLERVQRGLARVEQRQLVDSFSGSLHSVEFQAYSQWGEDGIIQYLINKIDIERKIFVEFGVANYQESNTRFLLVNNNWSGLVIDGSPENIDFIKNDPIYWRYNLKAEQAFIDRDNINSLIEKNGITGDIGLLSVDVDGNDYWIWQVVDGLNPAIIITEYNSLWGPTAKVTTPYDKNFVRSRAHYSNLYYGASIQALTELGKEKGYSLVGSNSAGNNLFFVRNDLLGNIPVVAPEDAWVRSQFRESRDKQGNLTFKDFSERLELVGDMDLIDVTNSKTYRVRDICEQ